MSAQPNALKQAAESAHALYSERFKAREAAETKLTEVARRRETLRAKGDEADQNLTKRWAGALADTIEDPSRAADCVASYSALRDALALLRDAEAHYSAYTFKDSQRAVIVCRIAELEAHVSAENCRLAHHEQKFHDAIRAAAELDPSIEVKASGGIADKLRALVAQLSGELQRARAELAKHDTETEAARAALEN